MFTSSHEKCIPCCTHKRNLLHSLPHCTQKPFPWNNANILTKQTVYPYMSGKIKALYTFKQQPAILTPGSSESYLLLVSFASKSSSMTSIPTAHEWACPLYDCPLVVSILCTQVPHGNGQLDTKVVEREWRKWKFHRFHSKLWAMRFSKTSLLIFVLYHKW